MMDVRRGRRGWRNQTLLPLRRNRQHSSTISCWYCDFKFSVLNEPLFRFGRRYSRYLRFWFSIGIGFSMATLLGVTVIFLLELGQTILLYTGNATVGSTFIGLSSLITELNVSLSSTGYLCLSTAISVVFHEFGHGLAAASEGMQMEYVAIFLAVLFPGALVAFDHASFQILPGVASLRVYCAGIWHNAALCAVCTMFLFLLPFMLSPFYMHGESPMVLDVPSTSPLSGYLSPRDTIISLDGILIHTVDEWRQTIAVLTEQRHSLRSGQSGEIMNHGRGYCVPHSLIEDSPRIQYQGNQTYCPNELVAFVSMSCRDLSSHDEVHIKNNGHEVRENVHCLDAKDVVKLKKCTYNDLQAPSNRSACLCSDDESCLTSLQLPGTGWVEIMYSSFECRSAGEKDFDGGESSCFETFVFVGDLISMIHSIHLTSYQPRWSVDFAAYLPNQLERIVTCTFYVSMVLALLNSLPVYFLDGEYILEASVHYYFSYLSSRRKRMLLKCCLLGGTFISCSFVLQTIFISGTQDLPQPFASSSSSWWVR